MKNTGTLHAPSKTFPGNVDTLKVLGSAAVKREKADNWFVFNSAFLSLFALGALFLRSPY